MSNLTKTLNDMSEFIKSRPAGLFIPNTPLVIQFNVDGKIILDIDSQDFDGEDRVVMDDAQALDEHLTNWLIASKALVNGPTEPVPPLDLPPDITNNWISGEHLSSLGTAIQRAIKESGYFWMEQSLQLKCQTKYINIRVDQRTGHFVVTGDLFPTLSMEKEYPNHFYKNDWIGSKLNPFVLNMVLAINKISQQTVSHPLVRKQVESAIEALELMVKCRAIKINDLKVIEPKDLMTYYGKK